MDKMTNGFVERDGVKMKRIRVAEWRLKHQGTRYVASYNLPHPSGGVERHEDLWVLHRLYVPKTRPGQPRRSSYKKAARQRVPRKKLVGRFTTFELVLKAIKNDDTST